MTPNKKPKEVDNKMTLYVIKCVCIAFWKWLKEKVIHILITVIAVGFVGIVVYINVWATLPSTLKDLKNNQAKNELLIQQAIKKSDSIANTKVDKQDFIKATENINITIQNIDKKTDKLYEYLLDEKFVPTKINSK
jgi:anionic cell wall polymer biosynthesis LytR-Cps2A-Psr (LCP) family protein